MTFIFAALLGNFLAWCVHAFTWWLRERALLFLCICGVLITAVALVLTFLIGWFLLNFDMPVSGPNPPQEQLSKKSYWDFIANIAFIWFFFAVVATAIASLQKKFFTAQTVNTAIAFCALICELTVASLLVTCIVFNTKTFTPNVGIIVCASFCVTLFILALIRPQVVKVQKWLWQQVKPQRAANE